MPQALNFKVNVSPGILITETSSEAIFPLPTHTHVKVFHCSHILKVAVEMA